MEKIAGATRAPETVVATRTVAVKVVAAAGDHLEDLWEAEAVAVETVRLPFPSSLEAFAPLLIS